MQGVKPNILADLTLNQLSWNKMQAACLNWHASCQHTLLIAYLWGYSDKKQTFLYQIYA